MDVKTTFQNDDLEEEVYMNQPEGFVSTGKENMVSLDGHKGDSYLMHLAHHMTWKRVQQQRSCYS